MSLSPTGPEGFKHVLKFCVNFLKLFQNISQECRATVVQVSRTCHREILANLQCETFATLVTMSCECLMMVARQSYENMRKTSQLSGEKIKLSDIRTNVVQHSHKCCATVVQIKMTISYIPWKVVRLLHDSCKIYFQN